MAKLRERNEALDCAVLARAALWLLGADRYGERFWGRLHDEVANAPLTDSMAQPAPASPAPVSPAAAPEPLRPRSWLTSRGRWLSQ
jgi:phage terminase large subunit GpA-like protein